MFRLIIREGEKDNVDGWRLNKQLGAKMIFQFLQSGGEGGDEDSDEEFFGDIDQTNSLVMIAPEILNNKVLRDMLEADLKRSKEAEEMTRQELKDAKLQLANSEKQKKKVELHCNNLLVQINDRDEQINLRDQKILELKASCVALQKEIGMYSVIFVLLLTIEFFLTFCVLFSAFADKLNEQMKAKDETVKSLVETGEECMRLASNAPGASGFSKAIAQAIADATNPPGSG